LLDLVSLLFLGRLVVTGRFPAGQHSSGCSQRFPPSYFFFFWIRATFPRYRYDQIMRLGWKVFIPVCLIWLVVVGCWMMSPWNIWK
jgi:NADH:ubiquinone oxidoreductase subunit H